MVFKPKFCRWTGVLELFSLVDVKFKTLKEGHLGRKFMLGWVMLC
jgi:hypothetical protein